MVDEFDTEANVPRYLTSAGFKILDVILKALAETESEVGTGEEIRLKEIADYRESEFIFEVDGDFEEVLTVEGVIIEGTVGHSSVAEDAGIWIIYGIVGDIGRVVHASIHQADIASEADDGNGEISHDTGSPSAGVIAACDVFIEFQTVDVKTSLDTEGNRFSLSHTGSHEFLSCTFV